ncbi:MAG: site-2 protease family protein [bacterium]|nr:site-2 protease family protein [bacterium]
MNFLIAILILLFSVVIHEVSHGLMADYLGDPTARYAGRLTLNPIKHLDPLGSIILPLILFLTSSPILVGWAKPVPINPYNLKDQRFGPAKVALAGPLSNIFVAIFFALLVRFLGAFVSSPLIMIFAFIVQVNLMLAIFNLMPIPPLDGSHILFGLFPAIEEKTRMIFSQFGIIFLIFFIFFLFPLIFPIVQFLYGFLIGY